MTRYIILWSHILIKHYFPNIALTILNSKNRYRALPVLSSIHNNIYNLCTLELYTQSNRGVSDEIAISLHQLELPIEIRLIVKKKKKKRTTIVRVNYML